MRARGYWLAGLCVATLSLLAAPPASAGSSDPPLREVLVVGNNWDGTADIVDPRTFQPLKRIDIIPDEKERMAELTADPARYAAFLGVATLVGEGHNQYVDDAFTSNDGRMLFVSRPSFADVIALDLTTGKLAWRVPVAGIRADHMAISPDGRDLVVSASTAALVHVIDTATGKIRANFESGDQPHENNYSRDGKRIFHASIGTVFTPTDDPAFDFTKGDRYFQVVDAETFKILKRVDIGKKLVEAGYKDMSSAVRPMAISRDERFFYFQLSFFHGFVEYDLQEDKITRAANLPLSPSSQGLRRDQFLLDSAHHGLNISGDDQKFCVAGTMSDYTAIVSRRDFSKRTIIDLGPHAKPYWSTNSGDGKHCFVSVSGQDRVAVISYEQEKEIASIPVGFHPQRSRVGKVLASVVGGGSVTPAPLGVQLQTRSVRAAGFRRGRSPRLGLRSSEKLTKVVGRLRRGSRTFASGRLSQLDGRGSLRLKARRKVRRGSYSLILSAVDDRRLRGKRTFRIRVR